MEDYLENKIQSFQVPGNIFWLFKCTNKFSGINKLDPRQKT